MLFFAEAGGKQFAVACNNIKCKINKLMYKLFV